MRMIASGRLVKGALKEHVEPASVDLRLSNHFRVPERTPSGLVSLSDKDIPYGEVRVDQFILHSGSFVLGTTVEIVEVPKDMAAMVHGRSSIGRLGLFIENAGWIDPGFRGEITLELFNASPNQIILDAGRRICQVVFTYTDCTTSGYQGKYQDQRGATESRIGKDEF